MTDRWPSFVTADLGDSDEDDAEMMRRWEADNREMQALIARGGVIRTKTAGGLTMRPAN